MKLRYLLVVGLLLTGVIWVQPVYAQEEWITPEIADDMAAGEIVEYWTNERMKNAIPYPMHSPEGPAIDLTPYGPMPNQADGEPGFSPGGRPGYEGFFPVGDSGASEPAPLNGEVDDILDAPGPHGYHVPFPFTMYEVNKRNLQKYPYRAIGRLFFVTSTGFNSSCSGSSIGGRAVLTAGHCVSDGAGGWHTKFIFRPAYWSKANGKDQESLEKWPGKAPWTYTSWHIEKDFCRDVGFVITKKRKVKVGNKKKKRSLSQYVGWLGHTYNMDTEHQHWTAFGYPAERSRTDPEFDFNGSRMFENHASFAAWRGRTCTPDPFCFGSYMTGGASGGPVVYGLDPTGGRYPGVNGGNFANGVNSTYYLGGRVAGGLCSPYFDMDVHNFIEFVQGE